MKNKYIHGRKIPPAVRKRPKGLKGDIYAQTVPPSLDLINNTNSLLYLLCELIAELVADGPGSGGSSALPLPYTQATYTYGDAINPTSVTKITYYNGPTSGPIAFSQNYTYSGAGPIQGTVLTFIILIGS